MLKDTTVKPKSTTELLSSFVGKEMKNAFCHSKPKKKANCCTFPSNSRTKRNPTKLNFLRNCDILKRKSILKTKAKARKVRKVIEAETTKKLVQFSTKLSES